MTRREDFRGMGHALTTVRARQSANSEPPTGSSTRRFRQSIELESDREEPIKVPLDREMASKSSVIPKKVRCASP